MPDDPANVIADLSPGARRLLDYVALFPDGARYAVLRHMARISEEDMVIELRDAVEANVLRALPGEPNVYDFVDESLRPILLERMGPVRLPRLQARAEGARRRVEGLDEYSP